MKKGIHISVDRHTDSVVVVRELTSSLQTGVLSISDVYDIIGNTRTEIIHGAPSYASVDGLGDEYTELVHIDIADPDFEFNGREVKEILNYCIANHLFITTQSF